MLTTIGGTLGLTSAYGVGDPTITRRRVEADLAVFREYRLKYEGMLEACTQQLGWSVEQYAKLPQAPKFLEMKEVPSFWKGFGIGLLLFVPVGMLMAMVVLISGFVWAVFRELGGHPMSIYFPDRLVEGIWIPTLAAIVCILPGPIRHFMAKRANGDRPLENARRQKAYEEAKAAALKAAERSKAAEDHRLRLQIRELEGLAKTVGEKEADVRRILATL